MLRVAHLLLGLLLAAVPGTAQTAERVYASGNELKQRELAQVETATHTVNVAMYSLTDRDLAEELAALACKGVKVRVYRDREQFSQETHWGGITTTGILLAAGIEVQIKGAKDLLKQQEGILQSAFSE